MGATRLRLTAPPYAGGDLDEEVRRLAALLAGRAGQARAAGVRLLVELAPGTLAPGPEWFRLLAGTLPPDRIGAVYDPGRMRVEGHVAAGLAVAALGPYLQHVDVRDMAPRRAGQAWDWACARPGEGLVCWPDVLTALAAAGLLRLAGDRPPERPGRPSRRGQAARRRGRAGPADRRRGSIGPGNLARPEHHQHLGYQ